jgi:hypothetical protein
MKLSERQTAALFILMTGIAACQPQGNSGSESAELESAPTSKPSICYLNQQATNLIPTKIAEWETVPESEIPSAVMALVQTLKTTEGQQGITSCTDSITSAIFGSDYDKNPVGDPKTETLALNQSSESMADGRRAYVLDIGPNSRYLYIPAQANRAAEYIRLRQKP